MRLLTNLHKFAYPLAFAFCVVSFGAEINGSLTLARITAPSAPAANFATFSMNVTTGTINCINSDSTNCFNVNLSGAAAPTLPATTTFYAIGASSGSSRTLGIAYAGTAFHTGARYDGTPASPTAVQATEQIAGYNAFGYDGTTLGGPLASVRVFANQNFTVSAHGSYMDFTTTPNGTTASAVVMRMGADAGITIPDTVSGGDKGAGTINMAGALWINGVYSITPSGDANFHTVTNTSYFLTTSNGYFARNDSALYRIGGSDDVSMFRVSAGVLGIGQGSNVSNGSLKTTHIFGGGAVAPTIASGFGTSPVLNSPSDLVGTLTIGTGGTANTGVITFGQTYANAPSCFAEDIGGTILKLIPVTTTTTMTINAYSPAVGGGFSAAAFGAGDTVKWWCGGG